MNPTNALVNAVVSIVNADTTMRTLCGRSSGLIRPEGADLLDGDIPVCTYGVVNAVQESDDTWQITLAFTAYAKERATAAAAIAILPEILTNPAFAALSLDVAPDPRNPAVAGEGDADTDPNDIARERADVTMTFLITPA